MLNKQKSTIQRRLKYDGLNWNTLILKTSSAKEITDLIDGIEKLSIKTQFAGGITCNFQHNFLFPSPTDD